MLNKISKKLKLIVFFVIVIAIAWFVVIQPQITFKAHEKQMEAAAKRYYELNSRELPSGERVKTLALQKLYDEALLENDFFIPLTKKTCSNENSWVKVRKESGEYKYYTYLECGRYKSKVDHEGPVIKLNGSEEIRIDKDGKYKEYGVKSVVDAVDGELKVSDVTIKGEVDSSTIGTYEIEYVAFDNLNNKTTVKRTVKVVRRLAKEIKEKLNGADNFKGHPENNYLRLSNIMFRVFGLDENGNVIIISDLDIANVNHTKLDKWLDYFYSNLNKNAKKMIVKSKFCSMTLDENSLNKTECESYTKERNVYIPSVVEINKAKDGEMNFMKPFTLSWVAEKKSNKEAYVTRELVMLEEDEGLEYYVYPSDDNFGVRPMMKIKGSALISSGNGTKDNPYSFNDTKKVKGSDLLNTREVGEYVNDANTVWRIVKIMDDGTTKVISENIESGYDSELTCKYYNDAGNLQYNPKDRTNVGYCINNRVVKYFDVSKFENHEITVPIYKNKIIYGEEIDTKKYKAVLSAPDMYEMFSAYPGNRGSYWLINSSKKKFITGAITEIGVPYNYEVDAYESLTVRPVGYFKSNTIVTSGKGTEIDPFLID